MKITVVLLSKVGVLIAFILLLAIGWKAEEIWWARHPKVVTVEVPGPTVEVPGPTVEVPGPVMEVPGPVVEVPGPTVEVPGPTVVKTAYVYAHRGCQGDSIANWLNRREFHHFLHERRHLDP